MSIADLVRWGWTYDQIRDQLTSGYTIVSGECFRPRFRQMTTRSGNRSHIQPPCWMGHLGSDGPSTAQPNRQQMRVPWNRCSRHWPLTIPLTSTRCKGPAYPASRLRP